MIPSFIDREMEVEQGQVICPRAQESPWQFQNLSQGHLPQIPILLTQNQPSSPEMEGAYSGPKGSGHIGKWKLSVLLQRCPHPPIHEQR